MGDFWGFSHSGLGLSSGFGLWVSRLTGSGDFNVWALRVTNSTGVGIFIGI